MRFPTTVKNRLKEELNRLQNEIESAEFPSGTRDGIYDSALNKIKRWREGEIDEDEFLSETFLNKKNEVYYALRLIRQDSLDAEVVKLKEKRRDTKTKIKEADEDGESFIS